MTLGSGLGSTARLARKRAGLSLAALALLSFLIAFVSPKTAVANPTPVSYTHLTLPTILLV